MVVMISKELRDDIIEERNRNLPKIIESIKKIYMNRLLKMSKRHNVPMNEKYEQLVENRVNQLLK